MTQRSPRQLLASIPPPSERRLAVRVTPDALRHIRAGHPWVFEESVTSISHEAASGDLAVIFDKQRRFAAIALYDPDSPIQLRILHAGKPTPVDGGFWTAAIERALELRRPLFDAVEAADRDQLAYRLVNGENDGLPGCIVDLYADVLVVKLYSAGWLPHLAAVTDALTAVTGADAVVLRLARNVAADDTFGLVDGDVIAGHLADGPVRFLEGALVFEADVRSGQKTGHFLDQRANRMRVGSMSKSRDVLDVFASTGGFSVHAAAGGATSVHAVDGSAPTLAAAERNMALNGDRAEVAHCRFTTEVGDAFDVMVALARSGATYDIVVVDPPSFAQRQADVERAISAYTRLTHLALRLVRRGGTLVQASCSSRITPQQFYATVLETSLDAGRSLTEIARTGHDVDHPVTFREGEYLKAGFWTVH